MAHQHKKQKVETSENERIFILNSSIIIRQMLDLRKETQGDSTVLVDEILHSIFFLGKVSFLDFSPHHIDNDMREDKLSVRYRNAFDHYSSHLPRRSPLSCLLDMIVLVEGQQNECQIIKKFQKIMNLLQRGSKPHLISSTICVSQKNSPDSIRYYGVSMCTAGRNPGRIMVAASCLGSWDSRVADAVMTYYPDKSKKSYFDGTIELPESVRCQTFSLSAREKMPPCGSCANLFGLHTTEKQEWAYGNCAEVESLSNLLKNESEVKRIVQPKSKMWTDENRQRAENNVKEEFRILRDRIKAKWNYMFYIPQAELPLINGEIVEQL